MSRRDSTTREELLSNLEAHVRTKVSADKAELLATFIQQYYATVSLDDLLSHELLDLYGAVISHWNLMEGRQPGETKIHIYNPQYEQHGWQSTHTVIEIAHDDMPFLVDSVQMELNARGFTTHMIVHVGGMKLVRDDNYAIKKVYPLGTSAPTAQEEAPIFLEIDRVTDPAALKELENAIINILQDVRAAVEDWQKTRDQVQASIDNLKSNPPAIDKVKVKEAINFLEWMLDDHFTFLGWRSYTLEKNDKDTVLKVVPGTGLGVLRESGSEKISRHFSNMTPEAQKMALAPDILIIAKTNTKSTVHRPAYTDYIGIKCFDEKGNIIGEHRIIGLFTSAAYNRNPKDIPGLCEKVKTVMKMSKLSPKGHAGKALLNILETLPRDDLFQTDTDELLKLSMGILQLQERRRIRLFVRKDIYGRFISAYVYVPRDRYNTELRHDFQDILQKAFHGTEVSFTTTFSDSVLARIHFMVRIDLTKPLEYDIADIESRLIEVGKSWVDELSAGLIDFYGEERGNEIAHMFAKSFPAGYRENESVRTAIIDIDHIRRIQSDDGLSMSVFRPIDEQENILRFKLYRLHKPVPLSDALPILENMGLRVLGEQPHMITLSDGTRAWVNDFRMSYKHALKLQVEEVKETFQTAFENIWYGKAENDGFNNLVLSAGLSWREIAVLRAYSKYMKQIGVTFNQTYIEETMSNYHNISSLLIEYFNLRFDPAMQKGNKTKLASLDKKIMDELDEVISLDEDRIIRKFCDIIKATLRTNYFQTCDDGEPKAYLSFKLSPDDIPDIPLPRPMYEIFVYSPSVEGVHLRSGKVARGGLRWSDRREDFRTEVLGLMKAQKVKNSVIVPAGAKGGFVPKNLPLGGTREEIMTEGISCYREFIRGLLDITDNVINDKIVAPSNTTRYDGDDPYLVVAADKGTATFSDFANEESIEYGHWLHDSFASGGKTGYDHKGMGITAKGAWESVKRHFRELGLNTQEEDFTVVGVGDMAGDVFGNGMLLSEHIRLVAAFNHMHIFIDPNPDAASSFKERERLFNMPRSSWADYDSKLISKGGGVFSRSAKAIKLTSEIKKVLNLKADIIEPDVLIRAILTAEVDLFWNGGIGTYVKASSELNSEIGDKANDNLRINGCDLKCRVVGEGGNLGFSQRARIEYALNGGKIYTDFIDNSAGVDCSDHEVNIKILLNKVVENGDMTEKQRNQLLADMTDDVSELVLKNNYYQTQAISIATYDENQSIDSFSRFMEALEAEEKLDREIEFLPDEKDLFERKSMGKCLTAPEISVLMAYSKICLKEQILASDIPEDPFLSAYVDTAFPKVLTKKYHKEIHAHSLRREIIATQISNVVINDMGLTFPHMITAETGATTSTIIRAYFIAKEVFGMHDFLQKIESLDYKVSSEVQMNMVMAAVRLLKRSTRWFIRNHRDLSDMPKIIKQYSAGVVKMYDSVSSLVQGVGKEHIEHDAEAFIEAGVPEKMAHSTSGMSAMFAVLDIVAASNQHKLNPEHVAQVYFTIGAKLELGWFREQLIAELSESHWDVLARSALCDDIDFQQRQLAISVIQHNPAIEDINQSIELWLEEHCLLVDRWKKMLLELRSSTSIEFVMLAVAARELFDINQASQQSAKKSVDDEQKCA